MKTTARDFVPNGTRKIRAGRPDGIGMPSKGNRNSVRCDREWTPGLLSSVANPAGGKPIVGFRPAEKSAETLRNERVERKVAAARPCPGCGMKVYVPRTCFCW